MRSLARVVELLGPTDEHEAETLTAALSRIPADELATLARVIERRTRTVDLTRERFTR